MVGGTLPSLVKSLSTALSLRILCDSPFSFRCSTQQSLQLTSSILAQTNTRRLMGSSARGQAGHAKETQQRSNNFQGNVKVENHFGSGKKLIFQCPDDTFSKAIILALQDHLCRKWGLFKSDAASAVEYAPKFVMKTRALCEAIGGSMECQNRLVAMKTKVETLLKESSVLNEVELFLESIGKKEDGPEALDIELRSDRGLVAVTRLLEREAAIRANFNPSSSQQLHGFFMISHGLLLEGNTT